MVSGSDCFAGRTVVVTGGASGNGREIALEFARRAAATVVIVDVREDPREGGCSTGDAIREASSAKAIFIRSDLSESDQIVSLLDRLGQLGGVDILINNAGVLWHRPLPVETADSFDRMLAVNVRAPFLLSQGCAPMMARRGGGAIVNVSSGAAFQSGAGYSLYTTSKAALQGLTITLATELGPDNIRVNAVVPGRIRTAMTTMDVPSIDSSTGASDTAHIPLGRYGHPIDIAHACAYLASDQAAFVTGASLIVDGGTKISYRGSRLSERRSP